MFQINNGLDNSVYAYMDWSKITDKSSAQYRLREQYRKTGKNLFDENGLADIFGRKVIACTSKYGTIGEEVEITFQNGVNYWNNKGTLFAIIGDEKSKNDPNYCEWGHRYGANQCCVVEFIVNSGKINNIKNVFPALRNNPVIKVEKTGVNFFNSIQDYLNEHHLG